MRPELKHKILRICEQKIARKGTGVGVSFYAFFSNKNDNPDLLLEAAEWWIMHHKLDHFEKATKVMQLVQAMA